VSWLSTFLRPGLGRLVHHPPKPLALPARYTLRRSSPVPPRISIVTPSFNAARFIGKTVESVVGQGYPNLEYIVQDGGSTDDTLRIVEGFGRALARVVSEPDRGQSDALNRGFRHATGEILAYLNADDLLLTGALDYVASYFSAHPDVDVVYGHRILVDHDDGEIGRWVLPWHDDDVLSWADYVPQETLFWRRSAWDAAGAAFDDTFQFAMDWDLIVRMRDSGARFSRVPRFLGAFRVHPDQKTSDRLLTVGAEEMGRIRHRLHGTAVTEMEVSAAIRSYLRRHLLVDRLYRAGVLRY
jgi:glycosyltransferase involved in cell wall biosynthesis